MSESITCKATLVTMVTFFHISFPRNIAFILSMWHVEYIKNIYSSPPLVRPHPSAMKK